VTVLAGQAERFTSEHLSAIGHWAKFLVRRLIRFVVSLAVVAAGAFFVLHLAGGNPVRAALGPTAPESIVRLRTRQLGLDDPLFTQFLRYLDGLVHGQLGSSFITGEAVSTLVRYTVPNTLALVGLALAVSLVLGVLFGLVLAIATHGTSGHLTETAFTGVTGFLAAVPEYLVAVALVVVFGLVWKVLPVAGDSGGSSFILPVLALAAPSTAFIARVARVEALRVMSEDYVRAARAKRLPPRLVYLRHVLPNMLTGVFTLTGLSFATMIASSVLVEDVFDWPGMGNQLVSAIGSQDYGVVQGIALVYAAMILVATFAVDAAIALLDPRTTLMEGG